jgi:oxalate---CoA ligase
LALPFLQVAMDGTAVRASALVGAVPSGLTRRDDAPAMLMATSGTTSKPKLVPLSHANVLAAAGAIGSAFSLGPGDLCLDPMPLHHVHGLISAALSSLLAGAAVHCTDGFAPAEIDILLRDLRPSWFTASPTMHLALREHYDQAGTRPPPGRLRFFRSSSAPLPPSAISALEALFQAPLIETYGLTETASVVCSNPLPPATRKQGSVGFALGSEIRVVDSAGVDCEPGSVGEIAIRGPSVITAYAGNAAPESFLDGWLLTGDIGRLDEDRYLFIVGRTKEVIKRGGLSVYPAEVDDALTALPGVAEAATFAVPHPTLGEDVVAAIVARAGFAAQEATLRAEIGRRLSTYKVPSVILIVPSIPKNEMGKIIRRQVASEFAAAFAPQGAPPAGETEQALLATWREVLGRGDIGVTDNLFLHGADPLRAARAAERIAASGLWTPTPKDLLGAPTVREQANRIRSSMTHAEPSPHG